MTNVHDTSTSEGNVRWKLIGPDGEVKASGEARNIITTIGDQGNGERAAGVAGALGGPTGMKLGTGSVTGANIPAKTGTPATLSAYLAASQKAFDATFPSSALVGGARVITFQTTWGPGIATTASAITEACIVNNPLADAAPTQANTHSRVALTPAVPLKGALDTVIVVWTQSNLGQ